MSDEEVLSNNKLDGSVNEQFASLLLAHEKHIYGFILALVPNLSDADDILQDTVLTMCRKFDQFSVDRSFLAWSIGIARHIIINFRRKQRRRRAILDNQALEILSSRYVRILTSLTDRAKALESCLTKLSEKDSRLIMMRYERGNNIKNIAKEIGRPVQGLYKTFARIHNVLRICVIRTLAAWEMA